MMLGYLKQIYKEDTGGLNDCDSSYIMKSNVMNRPTNLAYDVNTKVIYIRNINSNYTCPYISENGKFCRFIDNQIVEIN